MRIIKHEHACLVLEKDGRRLVIDPGAYTTPLADADRVVGVVLTHEHADHWTPEQLQRILTASPAAVVMSTAATAEAARAAGFEVEVVEPEDERELGPFSLRFVGGRHAVIHSSIPQIDNVGVLVDESVYYPGDSFAVPEGVEVQLLAAPASGPWMKIAESMDFVLEVAPRHTVPSHEMINSAIGMQLAHARLGWATEQGGGEYHPLSPGESLEI